MRRQSFLVHARQYRQTVRDYLRSRDAADPDSPHLLYLPHFMSGAQLDGRHVPRFREVPPDLQQRLAWGWVPPPSLPWKPWPPASSPCGP